jgi:hypothetical protein
MKRDEFLRVGMKSTALSSGQPRSNTTVHQKYGIRTDAVHRSADAAAGRGK